LKLPPAPSRDGRAPRLKSRPPLFGFRFMFPDFLFAVDSIFGPRPSRTESGTRGTFTAAVDVRFGTREGFSRTLPTRLSTACPFRGWCRGILPDSCTDTNENFYYGRTENEAAETRTSGLGSSLRRRDRLGRAPRFQNQFPRHLAPRILESVCPYQGRSLGRTNRSFSG